MVLVAGKLACGARQHANSNCQPCRRESTVPAKSWERCRDFAANPVIIPSKKGNRRDTLLASEQAAQETSGATYLHSALCDELRRIAAVPQHMSGFPGSAGV